MFAEINETDVITSINSSKTNPFSQSREGILYSVWYLGTKYPAKEIIDRHYTLNNQINPHPGFNTNNAQDRLLDLGFPIVQNDLAHQSDFFSKKDLISFEKLVAREKYDPANAVDHNIAKYLNQISWGKTKYWADLLRNPQWDIEGRKNWNSMHKVHKQVYKEYTWFRIIPKASKNRLIYFTIGIDRYERKQLLLKIDVHRESTFFNNEKQNKFDKLRIELGIHHQFVTMDDLRSYNWDRLVAESTKFIEENIENYHKIVDIIGNLKTIKASRICWNNRAWMEPSGRVGKSLSNSFESAYGFGNEEWIFDLNSTFDGYCYARLEPVNKSRNKLKGQQLDLMLYTLEQGVTTMQWIAKISDVEIVDEEQSRQVCLSEEGRTWKLERLKQLMNLENIDYRLYAEMPDADLYNIRFKPEDVEIFDGNVKVADGLFKLKRYILNDFDHELEKQARAQENAEDFEPPFNEPSVPQTPPKKIKKTFTAGTIEIDDVHREIQNALFSYLSTKHRNAAIRAEHTGEISNRRIDIVMVLDGKKTFFEIKSYPLLRTSIRAAVGQLIEYCFFYDANRASKLVIVSHIKTTDNIDKFMAHLRQSLGLNIYYHQFDLKDGKLKE